MDIARPWDSTRRGLLDACAWLRWTSPHAPSPFADFALCPVTIRNHGHEDDCRLGPVNSPSRSSNLEAVLEVLNMGTSHLFFCQLSSESINARDPTLPRLADEEWHASLAPGRRQWWYFTVRGTVHISEDAIGRAEEVQPGGSMGARNPCLAGQSLPVHTGILDTGICELRLDLLMASRRSRAAHMKLFCSALCV